MQNNMDKGVTFIGAIIVAVALLIAVLLAINWIISSQKLYIEKPIILVERSFLHNNTIYLTLKNHGKEVARIEKIYIYMPRINKYFIAYPENNTIIDGNTNNPVGELEITKTILPGGGFLDIQLTFDLAKTEIDYLIKGIVEFDKTLASFQIINYTTYYGPIEPTTPWKGVYLPQGGFKLIGYKQLMLKGNITAWRPPIKVVLDTEYYSSFIFDDSKYPGLYMIKIQVRGTATLTYRDEGGTQESLPLTDGTYVCIRGFVGTYNTPGSETYVNGYAHEIDLDQDCSNVVIVNTTRQYLTSLGDINGLSRENNILIEGFDYDDNGVNELVLFSLLNGPTVPYMYNSDADKDDDEYSDALVWEYMVLHDISNADYIRVTGKINYYWTAIDVSQPNNILFFLPHECLENYRKLRVISIVLYKLEGNTWKIVHYKPFPYTTEKPRQYVFNVVFPVNRTNIYRVGILFYDNYNDLIVYCLKKVPTLLGDLLIGEERDFYVDFTYTLEYLIIEIGVSNPRVSVPPPVYVLSISGQPVENIGEDEDEINASNALGNFTEYVKGELGFLGIPGYVVVDSCTEYSALLINPLVGKEPSRAIVLDLHGSATDNTTGVCRYSLGDVLRSVTRHELIWVRTAGPLFEGFDGQVNSSYSMNITGYGRELRKAYSLLTYRDELLFNFSINTSMVGNSFSVYVNDSWYTFTVWYVVYENTSAGVVGSVVFNVTDEYGNKGYLVYNGIAITPSGNLTRGVGYYTATQLAIYPALDLWMKLWGKELGG